MVWQSAWYGIYPYSHVAFSWLEVRCSIGLGAWGVRTDSAGGKVPRTNRPLAIHIHTMPGQPASLNLISTRDYRNLFVLA